MREIESPAGWRASLAVRSAPDGAADLRFDFGRPAAADLDRVRRLQLRRPRRRFAPVILPPPLPAPDLEALGPFDVYVGSGLSYEAGLPTLCDMHEAFGVDAPGGARFAVGDDDPLPARLRQDLRGTVAAFCAVHVGALLCSADACDAGHREAPS